MIDIDKLDEFDKVERIRQTEKTLKALLNPTSSGFNPTNTKKLLSLGMLNKHTHEYWSKFDFGDLRDYYGLSWVDEFAHVLSNENLDPINAPIMRYFAKKWRETHDQA